MITINEASKYLSRTTIRLEGLTVKVKVLDVRQVYNRVDALITTEASGANQSKWVDASRLS